MLVNKSTHHNFHVLNLENPCSCSKLFKAMPSCRGFDFFSYLQGWDELLNSKGVTTDEDIQPMMGTSQASQMDPDTDSQTTVVLSKAMCEGK